MRVLFLNQYFPPDPAPTGVLLKELADALQARGIEVDFVAANQAYRPGQGKGGRMKREMKALLQMLITGLRRPRADIVVSATSPPCLLLVATLVAWRHRARSVHWIMDLYPEIAVALGEVKPGAISAMIQRSMRFCYRRCSDVVTLDRDMAALVERPGVRLTEIRPWVFSTVLHRRGDALREGAESAGREPWTWIYSGNLGRAHEWETLLEAQAIVEKRDPSIRLLFQGGGPSWPAAQARAGALGLQRCEWRGYVDEAELPASLLQRQACAVTQLPAAQGMLWPSKLGLLLSLPRPIVWVGPTDGAIARSLSRLPHAGVFAPGQSRELAEWLLELRKRQPEIPLDHCLDPREHREDSLARWMQLLFSEKA